jgi:hypothetical protein
VVIHSFDFKPECLNGLFVILYVFKHPVVFAVLYTQQYSSVVYYKRGQHQYAGGGNDVQAGANVTTTMGSRRENRQLLHIYIPKERDKYTVRTIGRRPSREKGFYKF